jgi:hypothetical protein
LGIWFSSVLCLGFRAWSQGFKVVDLVLGSEKKFSGKRQGGGGKCKVATKTLDIPAKAKTLCMCLDLSCFKNHFRISTRSRLRICSCSPSTLRDVTTPKAASLRIGPGLCMCGWCSGCGRLEAKTEAAPIRRHIRTYTGLHEAYTGLYRHI